MISVRSGWAQLDTDSTFTMRPQELDFIGIHGVIARGTEDGRIYSAKVTGRTQSAADKLRVFRAALSAYEVLDWQRETGLSGSDVFELAWEYKSLILTHRETAAQE